MRVKASRAFLAVIAAFVMAMTLSVTPALASASRSSAAAAPSLTSCPWNGGTIICEYGHFGPYTFPDGQQEYWAVGTSHAVWTYWDDAGGGWHWSSLGGYATSGVSFVYFNGWALTIEVFGSDNSSLYCKDRGDTQTSGWGRWYLC